MILPAFSICWEQNGTSYIGLVATGRRLALIKKHIAEGKTDSDIAEAQFVSIETIKTHVQRIFRKQEVNNRMEALTVARKQKII